MRRGRLGPLTSAQVREGRRRALPTQAATRASSGPGKAWDAPRAPVSRVPAVSPARLPRSGRAARRLRAPGAIRGAALAARGAPESAPAASGGERGRRPAVPAPVTPLWFAPRFVGPSAEAAGGGAAQPPEARAASDLGPPVSGKGSLGCPVSGTLELAEPLAHR